MYEDYTTDDLKRDLALMVKAGLLDVRMREDGEWVYVVSDEAASMSEEERIAALDKMVADFGDDEIFK